MPRATRATRASATAAATSTELPPAPILLRAEDAEWWDAARAYDFLRGAASASESARKCRLAAKALFDCAKAHEPRAIGPLPALLVAGRDDETVWQQLELRNRPLLSFIQRQMRKEKRAADRGAGIHGPLERLRAQGGS